MSFSNRLQKSLAQSIDQGLKPKFHQRFHSQLLQLSHHWFQQNLQMFQQELMNHLPVLLVEHLGLLSNLKLLQHHRSLVADCESGHLDLRRNRLNQLLIGRQRGRIWLISGFSYA